MFVIIMKWSEGGGSHKEKSCNKVGHIIVEGKLGVKGMKTQLSEVFWFPLCIESWGFQHGEWGNGPK